VEALFEPSPTVQPPSWTRRRLHVLLSVLTWPGAAVVFLMHVARAPGFGDEHRVTWIAIWLVALGCLGCPAYALRAFADRLTIRLCLMLAAGFGSVSGLLTILFACGDVTVTVANQCLALVIPMAFAIQCFNAAESKASLDRAVRLERAAHARRIEDVAAAPCVTCNLRDQVEEQERRLRVFDRLSGLSDEEAGEMINAVLDLLAAERAEPLRLVRGHGQQ
jgi:hypothetical protein